MTLKKKMEIFSFSVFSFFGSKNVYQRDAQPQLSSICTWFRTSNVWRITTLGSMREIAQLFIESFSRYRLEQNNKHTTMGRCDSVHLITIVKFYNPAGIAKHPRVIKTALLYKGGEACREQQDVMLLLLTSVVECRDTMLFKLVNNKS